MKSTSNISDLLAFHERTLYTKTQPPQVHPVPPTETLLEGGIKLPLTAPLTVPISEVLRYRRSDVAFHEASVKLVELSAWLGYAIASQERFVTPEVNARPYPSAGALYPIQVAVVALRVDGLTSGLYLYQPSDHSLHHQSNLDNRMRSLLKTLFGHTQGTLGNASALILLTADFTRISTKYGARAYRFVLQESGHISQNLLLAATALGLGSCPLGGFRDDVAAALLNRSPTTTPVLYVIAMGPVRDNSLGDLRAVVNRAIVQGRYLQTALWMQWRIDTREAWQVLSNILPCLQALVAAGTAKGFWFLFKGDGGLHIRLRVQAAAEGGGR